MLAFVPFAAFFLSGCGQQAPASTPAADFGPTPNPAMQDNQKPQAPQASAPSQTMPALPADNTQAIDSELKSIDQELQGVEASLSADTSDDELGL